jgi:hypothetical protein
MLEKLFVGRVLREFPIVSSDFLLLIILKDIEFTLLNKFLLAHQVDLFRFSRPAILSSTTVELLPRQRVLGYDSDRIWP